MIEKQGIRTGAGVDWDPISRILRIASRLMGRSHRLLINFRSADVMADKLVVLSVVSPGQYALIRILLCVVT